mgnify:CR=1 FL=1
MKSLTWSRNMFPMFASGDCPNRGRGYIESFRNILAMRSALVKHQYIENHRLSQLRGPNNLTALGLDGSDRSTSQAVTPPHQNLSRVFVIDRISSCDNSDRHRGRSGILFSHLRDLFVGQQEMRRSKMTFIRRLSHIFRMTAENKMVRVYARRIVALVKHMNAGRDFSIMKFPRHSTGDHRTSHTIAIWSDEAHDNRPVAAEISVANPRPALLFLTNINISPESFGERLRFSSGHCRREVASDFAA